MDELIPLNLANMNRLPETVRRPRYRREDLSAGIVHIGLGNFHRAHQAWYLHRLFDAGLCRDWAIIGAGMRPADVARRESLEGQNWLTTLIELDPVGISVEVIASMIDYLPVEAGNATLIARMAQPDIRIVSLTITEGGYFIDQATGAFDATHPDIQHDAHNPAEPITAFGAMIEALRLRRQNGVGPFTGLSCDNLQGNGDVLRQTVVSLARLSDPDLADWIDTQCSFPNSMVDCIVPATGPEEIALVSSLGISDAAPVTHENFRQWVIEDDFCAGRPDLDKTGVTFSDDVHAYEMMKLRILNAGHQIVALPGELLGIETIAQAMANPLIRQFLETTVREEVVPFVAPVPDKTPQEYLDLVVRRFANPKIKDTTRRVAFDGSSRQRGFIFPSIRDGVTHGTSIDGLALTTAMWCKYCEGRREDGTTIEPNDPYWADLNRVAQAATEDPALWLKQSRYYSAEDASGPYGAAFIKWHQLLAQQGVEGAISTFLNRESGGLTPHAVQIRA